jgi:CHAD domain-containing protein
MDPDDRPGAQALIGRLDGVRDRTRERLLSALREPRFVTLLDELVTATANPKVHEEAAMLKAEAASRPMLEAPWKHLEAAAQRAKEDPSDAALHGARIRAKRMRYAAEAVVPVFGKRAAAFAKAAADLQDVLGEHQDSAVARAWLREAASSGADRFAAGQLVALEAQGAAEARERWPAAWKALSRKRLRFWS